ncbi:MAG: bifunctional 5,10-methylenetetrahydrofolate dehydrogenase/5,10-methenyltetrahydrofolate cyclohydrolase [candidate division WOR-3 bacterium]
MNKPLILDGKKTAQAIQEELTRDLRDLKERGVTPKLLIILVGNNPASVIYVNNKERACRKIGVEVETVRLSENAKANEVADTIVKANEDKNVHGIILQLPLPSHLNEFSLVELIKPEKDVDGLTSVNLGRLMLGKPNFVPATPRGIVELLVRNSIPIARRRVVIVGRGELVGKPLANLLLLHGERGDATVTVCHSKTEDLGMICQEAEILIVAAGRPGLITGDMVSDGVVVVDAGINRTEKGIVGDVEFDSVAVKAQAITPVPGGVGPMTVAMLLANVIKAAKSSV